jgi:hypothetical protein
VDECDAPRRSHGGAVMSEVTATDHVHERVDVVRVEEVTPDE